MKLYEDFARSKAKKEVEDSFMEEGGEGERTPDTPATHIFQVCLISFVE